MKSRALVVGGGIAGMVAALRASLCGFDVTLIEKQPQLGGLLASVQPGGHGAWFDQGTHIPAETGEAELDELLFGNLSPDSWNVLPGLKAGTFWNGRLNPDSPCLDLRTLSSVQYQAILTELLVPKSLGTTEAVNLAEQLREQYGPAMLDTVMAPILKKFFDSHPEQLAPDAHLLFGLIRFICLDPAEARRMKQDPRLDRVLAYHKASDAPSAAQPRRQFYPKSGGVGQWIDQLERCLRGQGVAILTGRSLIAMDSSNGTATIADGETIGFDQLIWSLPTGMLLRLCDRPSAAALKPPRVSPITFYHFVTDQPAVTDAHYVTCYDPALQAFRVTLYDNLQSASSAGTRLTVEILRPRSDEPMPHQESVFSELKRMKLLPEKAAVKSCHEQTVAAGFPILSIGARQQSRLAAELAERECPRVLVIGRASGRCFFMSDVLLDAWRSTLALSRSNESSLHFHS